MWTGKMTKTAMFFVAMIIGISGANLGFASDGTLIADVKLSPQRLPEGWKLLKEYNVSESDIRQFERRFAVPIREMLNQEFKVDGKGAVQINYVASSLEVYLHTIYRVMVEMVGSENVIVRKGSVGMEIISDSNELNKKAMELLELTSIQKRKLNAANMPEGWSLVREIFVTEDELEIFENKFQAKIEEVVNQFFIVGEHALRVNYIAGKSVEQADIIFKNIRKEVGQVNEILKKDNIVMEIITHSKELKKMASDVLSRI